MMYNIEHLNCSRIELLITYVFLITNVVFVVAINNSFCSLFFKTSGLLRYNSNTHGVDLVVSHMIRGQLVSRALVKCYI